MSEAIKVTVLMPSLNVGEYIRECMESVVRQSLKEIEILCIDAGSTDGTLEILREYADNDPRITLLHSEVKSYGHQINMGLERAKGEYIGIVETDDYIDPEMYRKLYEAAEKTGKPDVVKSPYYDLKPEEEGGGIEVIRVCHARSGDVFPFSAHTELVVGHPSIWSAIYKKAFLDRRKIRMKEEPGGAWVDNPFLFRTMCEAERICWVDEPFYSYRRTNPNASSHLKNCSIPFKRINDILDYLEENFKGDMLLEKHLGYRMLDYVEGIWDNPHLTEEDKKLILKTLRRFHPATVIRVFAGSRFRKAEKSLKTFLAKFF